MKFGLRLPGAGPYAGPDAITAFAQRAEGVFLEAAARPAAELACIETGMASLRILAEMDAQVRAAGALYWRPSLWAVMAP